MIINETLSAVKKFQIKCEIVIDVLNLTKILFKNGQKYIF